MPAKGLPTFPLHLTLRFRAARHHLWHTPLICPASLIGLHLALQLLAQALAGTVLGQQRAAAQQHLKTKVQYCGREGRGQVVALVPDHGQVANVERGENEGQLRDLRQGSMSGQAQMVVQMSEVYEQEQVHQLLAEQHLIDESFSRQSYRCSLS